MDIRNEKPGDETTIRRLITAAFREVAQSSQTEAAIVEALREAGALTVSLVAVAEGDGLHPDILGHIAFSPVMIDGQDLGWYGLGPIAVQPDRQNEGIGGALVRAGLNAVRTLGAKGAVVLGSPDYYGRFGFASHPGLQLAGVPPEYFQVLSFGSDILIPAGFVTYHAGFDAKD